MNDPRLNMVAPANVYRARRAELAAGLSRPLILAAGKARPRQYATNVHRFRAGSSYLYYGGPPVEGAALMIQPGSDGDDGCALLRLVSGFEEIVWVGDMPDDAALAAASGIGEERMSAPTALGSLLAGRTAGYVCPPCLPTIAWLGSARAEPATEDEMSLIVRMRLIKDEHELVAMRRAADVAVNAHLAAMRAAKPGRTEADVAAAVRAEVTASLCDVSFTPIVSIRGEVLHSETYANALSAGDLLLVDAGAEEPGGYASDATRTYPVTGSYSGIQRQLYDTVLRAMRLATGACVPGRRFRDLHDLAARAICEGLVEAKLLRGDPDELAARRAHTLFFTHGLGHLIGLDVHDMEDFGDLAGYAPGRTRREAFGDCFLRLDRDLEPGMVLTIEPGIYLVPAIWREERLVAPFADVVNRPAVDTLLDARFGGIRIEDTVHVRGAAYTGPEVLTAALPTDADEVVGKDAEQGASEPEHAPEEGDQVCG